MGYPGPLPPFGQDAALAHAITVDLTAWTTPVGAWHRAFCALPVDARGQIQVSWFILRCRRCHADADELRNHHDRGGCVRSRHGTTRGTSTSALEGQRTADAHNSRAPLQVRLPFFRASWRRYGRLCLAPTGRRKLREVSWLFVLFEVSIIPELRADRLPSTADHRSIRCAWSQPSPCDPRTSRPSYQASAPNGARLQRNTVRT